MALPNGPRLAGILRGENPAHLWSAERPHAVGEAASHAHLAAGVQESSSGAAYATPPELRRSRPLPRVISNNVSPPRELVGRTRRRRQTTVATRTPAPPVRGDRSVGARHLGYSASGAAVTGASCDPSGPHCTTYNSDITAIGTCQFMRVTRLGADDVFIDLGRVSDRPRCGD